MVRVAGGLLLVTEADQASIYRPRDGDGDGDGVDGVDD